MTITQTHIAEASALIVSLFFFKHIKKGSLFLLPFFLVFILIVELLGASFKSITRYNLVLYNFSIPFEYLFYFYLFYIEGEKKLKPLALLNALILVVSSLVFFIIEPFFSFHNYVLTIGELLTIISCCFYFYERFFDSDEQSLTAKPFFWICSGLFLFNLGELSYTILLPIIQNNKWDDFGKIYQAINNSFLLLLYPSYIIAILIEYKRQIKNA